MDISLLNKMVEEKLVSVQKHPYAELYIYNYTQKVQYEKLWNEITMQTRGLIMDSEMNIVAKGFGKFFNIEEHQPSEIPNLPFEVFEKMDGSLAILYWLNNKPYIATRGSFNSDQSIHANKILNSKYSHVFDKLDRSKTYLLEIIYRENRIVVDYGDMDDLILLAIIDTKTGNDCPLEYIGFPIVKKYDGINDIEQLRKLEENNKEGFVIKFKNGFRVKLKFQEYARLHRIITGVSNIAIWEYLSEGKPFDELLEKVPDEFFNFVKNTQKELINQFNEIEKECKHVFKELGNRKETAIYFQSQKYPSILFNMLDKTPYDNKIWKLIRPKFCKPFNTNIES
jgi:RNA ligase